ncbi:MAG TPA: hypothetical protein VIH21_10845 [Dehalococcoidia bacterium]
MKKHFVRALIVNAAVQFAITRTRAGRVEEEGAAEALWLRYPFVVVANALIWAIMFSTIGRVLHALRGRT